MGTVLYVAAHPDDENTQLIAYFSRARLMRSGYLSMTRGDGGYGFSLVLSLMTRLPGPGCSPGT